MRVFVTTPDFNMPGIMQGTRSDIIRSKWVIEDYEAGNIREGDPVVGYFDPEGESHFEYEAGWALTGTIAKLELRTLFNEEKIRLICYNFEESK